MKVCMRVAFQRSPKCDYPGGAHSHLPWWSYLLLGWHPRHGDLVEWYACGCREDSAEVDLQPLRVLLLVLGLYRPPLKRLTCDSLEPLGGSP